MLSGALMVNCAACGKKIGWFEGSIRCRHCGGNLCDDCGYTAIKANRCPACGQSNPR